MIRLIGFIVGLGFTVMVLWAFGSGVVAVAPVISSEGSFVEATAEREFHREPREASFSFDGPFGRWDKQQLQRGYQVYSEVCKACHSLKYVAFRDLVALGYTEAEVKANAATWTVPGIDPVTGEANTRPGTPTDNFPLAFPNDIAARAANNNAIPPDLSLMAKARHHGPQYIYSLLTGYQEQPAALLSRFPDAKTPTGLYYNPYFANLNLAMPPPLTDGAVTYADGTAATREQMAKDVSAFLMWTAEPQLVKRNQTGWAVLGFLIFATILAWLAKQQVWAGIKPKRRKD